MPRMELSRRARPITMLASAIVAVTTCSCDPGRAAPAPSTHFDARRAWADLEAQVAIGPRPTNTPEAEKTREFLERELRAAGLSPVRESFDCPEAPESVRPFRVTNVYADVPRRSGDAASAPIVALVSHYDTKRAKFPFVGANDGASSTAVLLEIARALAKSPSERVTWRLLFVDGEEAVEWDWRDPDNRYGSRRHVEALQQRGEIARVKACVVIDMIGDRDLRLTPDSYSDSRLWRLFVDSAKAQGLERHIGTRSEPVKDDHLSFMAANVPSVDLIDFEYGPHNSWWHTPQDTVDKCSPESLDAIGRIVLGALPGLETFATR